MVRQATVINFTGDAVFAVNLALWVSTAITASEFVLTPTLSYNEASRQVWSTPVTCMGCKLISAVLAVFLAQLDVFKGVESTVNAGFLSSIACIIGGKPW